MVTFQMLPHITSMTEFSGPIDATFFPTAVSVGTLVVSFGAEWHRQNTDAGGMWHGAAWSQRQYRDGCIINRPGFDPYDRDDSLHLTGILRKKGGQLRHNDRLRKQGREGEPPLERIFQFGGRV